MKGIGIPARYVVSDLWIWRTVLFRQCQMWMEGVKKCARVTEVMEILRQEVVDAMREAYAQDARSEDAGKNLVHTIPGA